MRSEGQIGEACAAIVAFGEVVLLYHGAHGAIDDENAIGKEVVELGGGGV